jgi:hypothetical protein
MTARRATYNERAWAIDLIGYLKQLAGANNRAIKDAGGEQTVQAESGSLFPDVLLFGDRATARILQGWELKLPDTDIEDSDFRQNAESKARALGLDSFLLWNVSHAHLFVLDATTNEFVRSHVWNELEDITTRGAVVANRQRWENLADVIFYFLNDLFDTGRLQGRPFIEAYRSGGVTALVMENSGQVADSLLAASRRDWRLRSEIALWWDRYQAEYNHEPMEQVLAKAVLSNWIGKILFSHILREKDERAQRAAELDENTTPAEALEVFRQLSEDCNFWTIFSDSLGLLTIPNEVWDQLKQFNRLLSDLRVGSVDQEQLSAVLEATVEVAVRKLRGQYPTPIELARLLVHLCVRDQVDDRVLDPCCGSGTIARAAIEQKLAAGVAPDRAAGAVYASDQDAQAVQIATFALAKPNLMHIPLRIFERDAFTLEPSTAVDFKDPSNGTIFTESLGRFEAITSNLPFVAQEGRRLYRDGIDRVVAGMGGGARFTRRADVAAYLPFSLHRLLEDGGRLGIVITNAWLGTDWGDAFYRMLERFYHLECVITSGAGRWFKNSSVVTNVLVMQRKTDPGEPSGEIKFVVLTRPLEEIADENTVQVTAAQIALGQPQNDAMTIRAVRPANLARFRNLGLGGNAQFVDCDWVNELPLLPLNDLFKIRRGERRGLNSLFYPRGEHGIEPDYIKPLVKSPSDFSRLRSRAVKEAFSCSRAENELSRLGHTGALAWIKRFETPENIAKLTTRGQLWYQMNSDTLAELVMFINYGERLFVGRVDPPAFADQRLVRLEPKGQVDIDLAHALLNSTISMFIIEGMGFGRGLGALDLSKDRIEKYMHILNPAHLDQAQRSEVKLAFSPLLERDVLSVADELEAADRISFDDAVIRAFRLNTSRQRIYDALLSLVEMRITALD